MVVPSHMLLFSAWNAASADEERNFLFFKKNVTNLHLSILLWLVAAVLNSTHVEHFRHLCRRVYWLVQVWPVRIAAEHFMIGIHHIYQSFQWWRPGHLQLLITINNYSAAIIVFARISLGTVVKISLGYISRSRIAAS